MNQPLKIGQPRFISKAEALSLHRASLDLYGGADGFLDEGACDSALAQARQGFGGEFMHGFPFGMAAAYGYHLAMNHAFRDGNKRAAFAVMVAFLRVNGWNFSLPDEEASGMMLDLIENHRSKAWLGQELERSSRPRPAFELRDFFAMLTAEHLQDHRGSVLGSTQVTADIETSLQEAAVAIPLIVELVNSSHMAGESGDLEVAARRRAEVVMLMQICRIAEDMGYEW